MSNVGEVVSNALQEKALEEVAAAGWRVSHRQDSDGWYVARRRGEHVWLIARPSLPALIDRVLKTS